MAERGRPAKRAPRAPTPVSSAAAPAAAKRRVGKSVPPAPSVAPGRRRRHSRVWLVVLPVLGLVLFGGAAYAVNRLSPPTYAATALLTTLPDTPQGQVSLPITGIWVSAGNSDAMLTQVAQDLRVDPGQLRSSLTVTAAPNAPVVSVTVTTSDARRSVVWANAVARELLRESLRRPIPGYLLQSISPAVAPPTPTQLVSPLMMGAAALLGALAGAASAQRLRRSRIAVPADPG